MLRRQQFNAGLDLWSILSRKHRNAVASCFVCGCGHSGTTLMANIIAGHTEVFAPLFETEIFLRDFEAAIRGIGRLRRRAIFAGRHLLVEKTPRHIRRTKLIWEIVPDAKLLIPVRDGRDVACSISKRPGETLQTGIDRWIGDNTLVLAERQKSNVHVFRYEDFIADSRNTLREICDFLEIEFGEHLLEYHRTGRHWFGQQDIRNAGRQQHAGFRNWQVNQPIFDGRGTWKADYAESDMQDLFKGPGRDLMEAFGYL